MAYIGPAIHCGNRCAFGKHTQRSDQRTCRRHSAGSDENKDHRDDQQENLIREYVGKEQKLDFIDQA